MTLDEAIRLAENGDYEAMVALARYYFQENDYAEAAEWSGKAADSKEATTDITSYAILTNAIKAHAQQGIGSLENALETHRKIRGWCLNILNISTASEEAKKIANENMVESTYGMGYCAYGLNDIELAIILLEPAATRWWNNEKINLLYGICLIDSSSEAYRNNPNNAYSQAYPYLKTIDTPDASFDDTLAALALLNLAIICRTPGIPNTPDDINASYQYVQRASKFSNSLGEFAKSDLNNYRMDAYGNFIYCEE